MALRNILRNNEPSLLKKSRTVTDFNKRLHDLLDDMRQTLIEANGLGLAAPQVGVLRRAALVVDISIEGEESVETIVELVNPEIIAKSGEQTGNEGCLSFPGLYGVVTRPDFVKVKAYDRNGKEFSMWGRGLTARAICHEVDHLDGVVFTSLTDQLLTEEDLERLAAEKAAQNAEQNAAEDESVS